jgi:hypothetical protein
MRSGCAFCRISRYVCLLIVTLALATTLSSAAEGASASGAAEEKLQSLVSDLTTRLSISVPVFVSIVPTDPLVMSVKPPAAPEDPFMLSVDAAFLDQLTDDELEAAIAHELGHVWVFTHHPFLQTEELANQIAMRVVSRESLERVYGKVWARGGTKGDLNRFLGSAPTAAIGLAPTTESR